MIGIYIGLNERLTARHGFLNYRPLPHGKATTLPKRPAQLPGNYCELLFTVSVAVATDNEFTQNGNFCRASGNEYHGNSNKNKTGK
ncbi:unnamed protein product [Ceratitis capitata]|uniref:(Mediterranean fruit fly) hypothetical protein n=1 Tax=Ceratitis capitata TaxID=7213 RepID=A0A811UMH8_CERCA|nr:unnamed protein product [Ceratitis capitata]